MNRRELIAGALAAPFVASLPVAAAASPWIEESTMSIRINKVVRALEYRLVFPTQETRMRAAVEGYGLPEEFTANLFNYDPPEAMEGFGMTVAGAMLAFRLDRSHQPEKVDYIYPRLKFADYVFYTGRDVALDHVFARSGLEDTIPYKSA